MSRDVEDTLLKLFSIKENAEEEAAHYLEEMELNGRYAKDVY
jgi:sulfite reductase (NADPH) flavoprotein alpha-component